MFLGFVRNEEERSSIGGRRWSDNFVSTIGCKITLRVIRVSRVIEINEKFDSRWNFVRKCERDELEMEYFFFFFFSFDEILFWERWKRRLRFQLKIHRCIFGLVEIVYGKKWELWELISKFQLKFWITIHYVLRSQFGNFR